MWRLFLCSKNVVEKAVPLSVRIGFEIARNDHSIFVFLEMFLTDGAAVFLFSADWIMDIRLRVSHDLQSDLKCRIFVFFDFSLMEEERRIRSWRSAK